MNQKSIKFKFQFHDVGQGLFYTGDIENFHFVYDCGGESSYIDNAVKKYSRTNLDLLVLSHMHNDHTNGLNKLLSQTNDVDLVILPYLHPAQRVLCALDSPNAEDWYFDLLVDPLSFLIEKGVKKVAIIGGFEPDPESRRPAGNENTFEEELSLDIDTIPNNKYLWDEIKKIEEIKETDELSDKILVRKHSENFRLSNSWFFRFYNKPVTDTDLKNFKDCITDKDITTDSLKGVIEYIKDFDNVNDLQECYEKIRTDINQTSLCMYHGPLNTSNARTYHPRFLMNKKFLGHLLTGDFDLSIKKNYKSFVSHYRNYLRDVKVFQVPHHGSKESWNEKILQKMPNSEFFLISSGAARKKHPSKEVVDDILGDKQILFCNEGNRIKITGKYY